MKKILVGGLAVAASLGLAAGSAQAAKPFNFNSDKNWSDVLGLECTKVEAKYLPIEPEATYWIADMKYAAVIAKGGNVSEGNDGPGILVYEGVEAGDMIKPPLNNGGQQAAISWLMFCEGDDYPPYEPPSDDPYNS
jgi:hypothetical protein